MLSRSSNDMTAESAQNEGSFDDLAFYCGSLMKTLLYNHRGKVKSLVLSDTSNFIRKKKL